jgi:predicted enzyme related to lactoylglutathione lyase
MTDLQTLPGIGSGLAAELRAVGIRDVEGLRAVGIEDAAARLDELGLRAPADLRRLLADALGEPGPVAGGPVPVLGVDNVLFAVGDLDEALEHYAAGIGLPVEFRLADPPLAVLRLGAETPGLLLREDRSLAAADASARSARVWLEVPDAPAAAEHLRAAGISLLAEPFAVATGHVVEVADRWGNVVGLTDHSAAPERARRPVSRPGS